MAQPQEIPDLARELASMTKEYLQQETKGQMQEVGQYAGFGLGATVLFCLSALLFVASVFALLLLVLPDTHWWKVGARFLAALVAALAAFIIGRRAAG
ncbi:MAG TPA: phage holin family protein [Acidimicrobiia bacterium]|jgi:hypothetical protein